MSDGRGGRRKGNLPAEVTSFIGRRTELAEAKSLLRSVRLLTLTGVGGVGKTRLALRVAEELARGFRDGTWFVDLGSLRDPELVPSSVAAAFGLGDQASVSSLDRLSAYLTGKQLLIVLDNCEHLIDACASLAGKLLTSHRDLRMLATSREALNIQGEWLLTVPPLKVENPDRPRNGAICTVSEAVRLFAERAAAVLPSFEITSENAASVSGICSRLDGIPLAIELAAAQIRVLSADSILARLDDRFRLLGGRDQSTLARHQTLRQAIEWSYDGCSAREQTMWAMMSVFTGSCDIEAIEQVCMCEEAQTEDVIELLTHLVNKSIITVERHGSDCRYRLLEIIRDFGREKLISSGNEETIRARHWEHYTRLVAKADEDWFGPRQAEWINRLRMEQANLRAALEDSFVRPGGARTGLQMVAVLHLLWVITGELREGARWSQRMVEYATELTESRARALHGCAYLLIMLGKIDMAFAMLEECRSLARRLGDRTALAYADLRAGSANMYLGDLRGASVLLEGALAAFRDLGDRRGTYFALRHLAANASAAGDPHAYELAEECLKLCTDSGASVSKSWALWVVGLERWRSGDIHAAAARIREAFSTKTFVADLAGEAHCVELLAWATADAGEMEQAARLFGAARVIWWKSGSSLIEFGFLRRFHDAAERRIVEALGQDTYQKLVNEGGEVDDVATYMLATTYPNKAQAARFEEKPALTPREREVANLVGQGLSNKEIASRMVIAQRTAECHVENILTKLGFRSRTQIAAWITQGHMPG